MLGAFVAGLGLSAWKVTIFLPTKPLHDDDTTAQSVETLEKIMIDCNSNEITEEELFEKILIHPEFDTQHFWRFNPNRLRHLIDNFRLKNPNFRR